MKSQNIRIRDAEKNLFIYLFLNKVATSKQIQRDIYQGISHQALYKRLNRLIDSKYLSANYHKELNGRLVFSLSQKAFNEFVAGKSLKASRQQLASNSVLHDLDLVDISFKLKRLNMVRGFFTENFIRSELESLDEENLKELKGINFDAIIKVYKDGRTHFLPLEYERTLKFVSRYKDYFKKVYSRPEVSAILYICQSQKALEKIQSFEKAVLKEAWPKVFYSTLYDFFKNTSVTFYNLKSESIILD